MKNYSPLPYLPLCLIIFDCAHMKRLSKLRLPLPFYLQQNQSHQLAYKNALRNMNAVKGHREGRRNVGNSMMPEVRKGMDSCKKQSSLCSAYTFICVYMYIHMHTYVSYLEGTMRRVTSVEPRVWKRKLWSSTAGWWTEYVK